MSKSIEQSVKDKLKQVAKDRGVLFNFLWRQFVLERFLVRLSKSPHQDKLIFKGGMLLAKYMSLGRETTDLDFLLQKTKAQREHLEHLINEIIAVPVGDGFVFQNPEVSELLHMDAQYPMYRISILAALGQTKTRFAIDIGVGDAVEDQSLPIQLTHTPQGPVFEEGIFLRAYPIEYIFAEKLETACTRGPLNSRMKDYHDLWLMIETEGALDDDSLKKAIKKTFDTRGAKKIKIPELSTRELQGMEDHWSRHLRTLTDDPSEILPRKFIEVYTRINDWIEDFRL
jgi:predicted nucleotidyltransferase component of viral defense system